MTLTSTSPKTNSLRHQHCFVWVVAVFMLLPPSGVLAQEYRFEYGAQVGISSYLGDANPKIPFNPMGGAIELSWRYNHNFRTAFSAHVGYALLPINSSITKNTFPNVTVPVRSTSHFIHTQLLAEYNFAHYSDKFAYLKTQRLVSYILGGMDIGFVPAKHKTHFVPGVTLGFGIKYKIRNRLNLLATLQGFHYFSDALDAPDQSSAWLQNPYRTASGFLKGGDGRIAFSLGLTYEFGLNKKTCHNNTNAQNK